MIQPALGRLASKIFPRVSSFHLYTKLKRDGLSELEQMSRHLIHPFYFESASEFLWNYDCMFPQVIESHFSKVIPASFSLWSVGDLDGKRLSLIF